MTLPYSTATSGKTAIAEIQRILQAFGAASFGHMENYAEGEVILQFEWRERRVSIKASARGYAALWLKENPWSYQRKASQKEHEKKALHIGQTAVYSILRDWIKGQITAIECGMLSFEGAFLGQLLLQDGRTVLERVAAEKLLPATKITALPGAKS